MVVPFQGQKSLSYDTIWGYGTRKSALSCSRARVYMCLVTWANWALVLSPTLYILPRLLPTGYAKCIVKFYNKYLCYLFLITYFQ